MLIHQSIQRFSAYRNGIPVRWLPIALLALVITYIDGYWMTALQGAIGAIERNEPPFTRWLRDSTLMLPLVVLAVLGALLIAHRWVGNSQHPLRKFAATTLLITLISTGVGITEVAASSVRDYQFQSRHAELLHSYGAATQPGSVDFIGSGAASSLSYNLYCNLRGIAADNAISLMQYATFTVHVRAVLFASLILLITNLILVTGLLALLSDLLWSPRVLANRLPIDAAMR